MKINLSLDKKISGLIWQCFWTSAFSLQNLFKFCPKFRPSFLMEFKFYTHQLSTKQTKEMAVSKYLARLNAVQ